MNYASLTAKINSEILKIKESMANISTANFDGYWTGSAHDNLTGKLKISLKNLENQLQLVSNFANALSNLDYYKTKGNEIGNLEYSRNANKVASLQQERATLLKSIINLTGQIKAYQPQDKVIKYTG